MFLEEFSYKIEIRKGTDHANADGMSRGCHGKKCICDEVELYETMRGIRVGSKVTMSDEGKAVVNQYNTNATLTSKYETRVMRYVESMCAFRLKSKYDLTQLAEAQKADPDIKKIYEGLLKDPPTKPEWNSISGASPATKAYYSDWRRLVVRNNVVYRK